VLSSALVSALCIAILPASAQGNISGSDEDGDGLSLMQEKVLGTNPTHSDTDGDGVSDLEELARGSSALSAASQPDLSKQLGLAMTANAESDGLHALVCVYMSDTNLRSKSLQVGLFSHDRLLTLSDTFLATNGTLEFKPSITPTGAVAVIDVSIPAGFVHASQQLTLWATAALPNVPGATATSAIHLTSIGGVVAFAMPAPSTVIAQAGPYPGTSPQSGRGTIYVPLVPPPIGGSSLTAPPGWASGEVCFQRSSLVGVNGATLTNEIVTADCASGWDGFCPPTCTSTVGSTYKTVDPLVLLGG
jgi:hypothetical protein